MRYVFKMEDFIDLKKQMEDHHGTYLLNLSMTDPEMISIFGNPNLIIEHHRQPLLTYQRKRINGNAGTGGSSRNGNKAEDLSLNNGKFKERRALFILK